MAKKFGLIFGRNDEQEGYDGPSASLNRFPKADIITRELIQNALDASVSGKKTEVSFDLEQIPVKSLPFLKSYREAFEATKEYEVNRETDTIELIGECLNRDKIPVLWIKDKGVGLGSKQMNELLKAGKSEKQHKRGSYGLGHFSTFPASTLRYVVYGGCAKKEKSDKKEEILSGQCILASHLIGKEKRGPKGSICLKQREDSFNKEFPQISDLDDSFQIWKDKIKEISKEGTGSFVCIAAFNNFDREDDVEKEILHAAASHFMPAIFDGKMEVRFGKTLLDKDRLRAVLEYKKKRKNRDKGQKHGAAGKTFYRLYQCMLDSHKVLKVNVGGGEQVTVYMDPEATETGKQIHLYRDGMWITDEVPDLTSGDFSNYRPFTALILVDQEDAQKVQELVTKTETECHMEIDMSALKKQKEKQRLEEVLQAIKKEIIRNANKISENGKDLDYITYLRDKKIEPTPDIDNTRKNEDSKKPQDDDDDDVNDDDDNDDDGQKPVRPIRDYAPRKVDRLMMPCAIDSIGQDKILISARVDEKHGNVGMRLIIRSGADKTCDLPMPDETVRFWEGSTQEGKAIAPEKHKSFKDDEKGYDALHIGALSKGELNIVLRPLTPPPADGQLSAYAAEFFHWKEEK